MITFFPASRKQGKRFRATTETRTANNFSNVLYLLQNFSSKDNSGNTSLTKKPKTILADVKS